MSSKDISLINSIESESGIIATILNHPDYIFYSEELRPNHFSDQQNAYIYWAVTELAKKGVSKVDAYNITNILNSNEASRKQTDSITIQALNELISLSQCIARDSTEDYLVLVKTVLEKAFRRDLLKELQKCERMCFLESDNDIKSAVYNSMDKVMSNYLIDQDIVNFGDIVDKMWEEIKDRYSDGGVCGYPSMIKEASNYFTYEKSELVLVCAARKDGKSMWCLNELVDKLKRGVSCLYIDTEMKSRQHMERMVAHLTNIPVKLIKNGGFTKEQEQKILETIEWIKTRKYVHLYMPNPTKDKIFSIVKKLKIKMGLQFLIFDYIKSQNSNSSSEIYNIMGDYTDFLKNRIAGELDLPVLAAAQLNRGGEIADSFKLEQFSSVVANIKRKKPEEIERDGRSCGNYKLFIKLNRLGEQMSDIENEYIDLHFEGNVATFKEAKQHEYKEPY